jgi:hypothetical protein
MSLRVRRTDVGVPLISRSRMASPDRRRKANAFHNAP